MSLRYLLDTNAVSEPLRPTPNLGILRRLQEHQEEIGIPAPVWHELLFGCLRLPPSRKREAIEVYLSQTVQRSFPILPYDEAAAEWHASERARLSIAGKTPPYIDGQIAAVAKTNGLVLVTANLSDFNVFTGLEIEDWRG